MIKDKIKTAVIGTGNMGRHHVRVYAQISNLVGIAEILPEVGRAVAKQYQTKYYQHYQDLLDKSKPDVVSVAVPTKFHDKVALECLQRKIPVLVEKPIAASVNCAYKMLEEAKKENVFLMVGHIERFNPAVIKLKKLIEQGRLGKILSLLAIRVGISPPKTSLSDVTLELGIHDLDIFNFILGEFPKTKKILKRKIFKNNLADASAMLFEYNDAVAIIQTNWITPIKIRKLYVTGIAGFAELDYINQKLVIYNEMLNFKDYGDFFELLSLGETPKKKIFISKKEPLKEEISFFIKNRNSSDYSNLLSSVRALEILTI